jgi:hypothetical protein
MAGGVGFGDHVGGGTPAALEHCGGSRWLIPSGRRPVPSLG